jgi:hypothetical protein
MSVRKRVTNLIFVSVPGNAGIANYVFYVLFRMMNILSFLISDRLPDITI